MKLLSKLLVLVSLVNSPAAQDTEITKSPCRTCSSTGTAPEECIYCAAEKKAPCTACALDRHSFRIGLRVGILRLTDPEEAKRLEELHLKVQATVELVGTFAHGMGLGSTGRNPGRLPCPACSTVVFRPAPYDECKLCSGDKDLKCKACKGKGETKCRPCNGKKTRTAPCPECVGSGASLAPVLSAASSPEPCPWCLGAEVRDCAACSADGMRVELCPSCWGAKLLLCKTCSGTGRGLCYECKSIGRVGKRDPCPTCGRKGYVECEACTDGELECEPCGGRGRGSFPCELCFGGKKTLCPGSPWRPDRPRSWRSMRRDS